MMRSHPSPTPDVGLKEHSCPATQDRSEEMYRQLFLDPLERLGVDIEANEVLCRFLGWCAALPGVTKLDHCTFVTHARHTALFLDHWASLGFSLHGEWNTTRYPARHLALTRGKMEGYPWEDMVGLTVSDHPDSPLHRMIPPMPTPFDQTHQLQHIAINIAPEADMAAVRAALQAEGVCFMTPILSYAARNGAGLQQMFTATESHFFVEFAQRIPSEDGEPFGGFHIETIDDLYAALDRAETDWTARSVETRAQHRRWLPRQVRFRADAR